MTAAKTAEGKWISKYRAGDTGAWGGPEGYQSRGVLDLPAGSSVLRSGMNNGRNLTIYCVNTRKGQCTLSKFHLMEKNKIRIHLEAIRIRQENLLK